MFFNINSKGKANVIKLIPESKYAYKMASMWFIALAGIFLGINEFVSETVCVINELESAGFNIPSNLFLRLSQISVVLAGISRVIKQEKLQVLIDEIIINSRGPVVEPVKETPVDDTPDLTKTKTKKKSKKTKVEDK